MKPIIQRIKDLTARQKVLFLSLIVGGSSGLAAVVLTYAIRFIKDGVGILVNCSGAPWLRFVFPGAGMMLALLVVSYLVKDNISHGVTKVLLAVSKNDSRIKPHNMWSSLVSSALTIGFGGSVGAEAPIVYTGAAIGSCFAKASGLEYKNMTILLGCGAAGAIAGIFKAPLAGVIFTMEILLFNVSLNAMAPMLLSAVSATVVSYIFSGQVPPFAAEFTPFSMANIPFYIILGIVGAFGSLYFTRVTLWMEDKISGRGNRWLRWATCSVIVGLLVTALPMLWGEGYDFLRDLLAGTPDLPGTGWLSVLVLLGVFLMKVISMTFTNSGGGVGGTFGPTLFSGAILGFVVARSINLLGGEVPEQNFVLVGMAALMAGVMQAPMTAIFLIAEISGGYELFLPLILTSTVSFAVNRIFEKYSIYTKRIAASGELLTHDNDQAVLTLLRTSDLVRDKYPRVDINHSLRDLVQIVSESTAAVFPVVDGAGKFQGLVNMDTFRKYILQTDLYDSIHVFNIMEQPEDYVREDEKMDSVLSKFERTGAWRLPVVGRGNRYLGFISKSRILSAYREELKKITSGD